MLAYIFQNFVSEELKKYFDFNFSITLNKSKPEIASIDDYIFSYFNNDIENVIIEANVVPNGKKEWKNNLKHSFHIIKELKLKIVDSDWIRSNLNSVQDNFVNSIYPKDSTNILKLNKKDDINGEQLTVQDLQLKLEKNIIKMTDKSTLWIKNLYENIAGFTFYIKEDETTEKVYVVWSLYKYSNDSSEWRGSNIFYITVEIED